MTVLAVTVQSNVVLSNNDIIPLLAVRRILSQACVCLASLTGGPLCFPLKRLADLQHVQCKGNRVSVPGP